MIILVILAHPSQNSFNSAIAATACRELCSLGHKIRFHDLYQECFDPVIPLSELDSGRRTRRALGFLLPGDS